LTTYHLGTEEISSYLRDLAGRISGLGEARPIIWVALGNSGKKIVEKLFNELPKELQPTIRIVDATFERASNTIKSEDLEGVVFDTKDCILAIDDSILSGAGMLALCKLLRSKGAQDIVTYALILKRDASIIPTFFGVLLNPHDRLLLSDELPNNELNKKPPFATMRALQFSDYNLPLSDAGAPFEGLTAGDLIYDMGARNSKTYIFEYAGEIASFISFRKIENSIFVDAWGTVQKYRGKGLGAPLLRWAETWAKSNGCSEIVLWAYREAIEGYSKAKFTFESEHEINLGAGQSFRVMKKAIFYNTRSASTAD
jgi:GNAT superfamily N-acetyltransferase